MVGAPAPAATASSVDVAGPDDVETSRADARAGDAQPGVAAAFDPRPPSRPMPRASAIVRSEIAALEALLQRTPPAAPDRRALLGRLAGTYEEAADAALLASDTAGQAQALRKAVQHNSTIRTDFPNDPKLDEVLLSIGADSQRLGDGTAARKAYLELIQMAPQSPLIPHAYLAFGEMFFEEAQSDPSKLELAKQAYLEVLKYPPPANKAFGYAHYKLAFVCWNRQELPQSLLHFKKVIDWGLAYPTQPSASSLVLAARRDIVPVYALAGRPDVAVEFFRTMSGDAGASLQNTAGMVLKLADNYVETGHYVEAVAAYRALLPRHADQRCCAAARKHLADLSGAGVRLGPSVLQAFEADIQRACRGATPP